MKHAAAIIDDPMVNVVGSGTTSDRMAGHGFLDIRRSERKRQIESQHRVRELITPECLSCSDRWRDQEFENLVVRRVGPFNRDIPVTLQLDDPIGAVEPHAQIEYRTID